MCAKAVVDGLILREYRTENDKILTILTSNGRISVSAKGAKSPRSQMLSVTNLFTYGNFEYYEKGGRKWLSSGTANERFLSLMTDIRSAALASYIAELAIEISGEDMDCDDILRMTLNTLYVLNERLKPYDQIKAVYEIFAADISGFLPSIDMCRICGKKTGEGCDTLWLDVMNGAVICDDCIGRERPLGEIPDVDELMTRNIYLPLDMSALAAMKHVLGAPMKRKFAFALTDPDSMARFARAAETYLINHLERSFDSLEFYRSCKE